MVQRNFLSVFAYPLIHSPEVTVGNIDAEVIDEPGYEGKLLGGSDWSADTHRVVCSCLSPGVNTLEGLGEVEVLQGIVEHDLKPRPGKLQEIPRGELGRILDNGGIEGGVVPPGRGDLGFGAHGG